MAHYIPTLYHLVVNVLGHTRTRWYEIGILCATATWVLRCYSTFVTRWYKVGILCAMAIWLLGCHSTFVTSWYEVGILCATVIWLLACRGIRWPLVFHLVLSVHLYVHFHMRYHQDAFYIAYLSINTFKYEHRLSFMSYGNINSQNTYFLKWKWVQMYELVQHSESCRVEIRVLASNYPKTIDFRGQLPTVVVS